MKKVLPISLILLLLWVLILSWKIWGSEKDNESKQVVAIDNVKVFESFEMKKDYDVKIESELMREKLQLDSLNLLLENSNGSDLVLKKEFELASQNLKNKFDALSSRYTNEVYARLNDYIKEFGKKMGIRIIVGSTGSGNIMYLDEKSDVTQDLIKYINTKYTE